MKKFIVMTALLLAGTATFAQAQSTWGVAWTPGFTTGNTADFASGFRARGISLEMRNFVRRDLAWGLSAGWNVFNQEDSGTGTFDNTSVTGNRWRYVNAIPIYAGVFKYTSSDRRAKRFYFGLNAGTQYIELRQDMGIYTTSTDQWHLALAPEIGVQMPWDNFIGYLGVRYNYGFSAGDHDAQSWVDFKVGFGLD